MSGYEKVGWVVVGLEEDTAGIRLLAVEYDYENGRPDETTARLLATYDPAHEIIIQFKDLKGDIRTQRLGTAPGGQHPKQLYFFEMMRRVQEEPESLKPGDLRNWFIEALERLGTMAKEKEGLHKEDALCVSVKGG